MHVYSYFLACEIELGIYLFFCSVTLVFQHYHIFSFLSLLPLFAPSFQENANSEDSSGCKAVSLCLCVCKLSDACQQHLPNTLLTKEKFKKGDK